MISYVIAVLILLANAFASAFNRFPTVRPATSTADTVVVYGPKRFATPTGSATWGVERFSVAAMPGRAYLVRVTNGAADGSLRATSAAVVLNGATVLTLRDLGGATSGTKAAALLAEDTVEVSVTGVPGAYVTLSVLEVANPMFAVYGPQAFVRGTGSPASAVTRFSIGPTAAPPYRMLVVNGNADGGLRASSAVVTLNGMEVLGANDLNQRVGAIAKQVTLQRDNVLTVKLVSIPDSRIAITFAATDTTPPLLEIVGPAPALITGDTSVVVTGTVQDETATLVSVGGIAAERNGSAFRTAAPLPTEGKNAITIAAIDAAGNRTDSVRSVTRDTRPPAVIVTAPADSVVTNQSQVTVAGTVTDLTTVSVNVNGLPLPVTGDGAFSGTVALTDGANFVTVTATDGAGNTTTVPRYVMADRVPPVITVLSPADGAVIAGNTVTVSGAVTDASLDSLTVNGTPILWGPGGAFSTEITVGPGSTSIVIIAWDRAGNQSRITRAVSKQSDALPPDPATVAPPLPQAQVPAFDRAVSFLYSGSDPVQRDVAPGAIQSQQAAVVRGRVITRDGQPLSGASVGIIGHPELGHTLSRADGMYDLVVNGGGPVRLSYAKTGYLSAERAPTPRWQDYNPLADVALVALDSIVTVVDFSQPIQAASSTRQTDADGARRAIMMFTEGTHAGLVMPDGSNRPTARLSVRATEFTVGRLGALALPAPLPPSTAYTYAAEFSADEAIAAGAAGVAFDQPVALYVDNFLRFPVGFTVPVGYFDRARGVWISSAPARVIGVAGVTGGLADLLVDTTGSVAGAEALAALGIGDAERRQVASSYRVGQTMWRTQTTHLTAFDFNPAVRPRPDTGAFATDPSGCITFVCRMRSLLSATHVDVQKGCESPGSIIDCDNRALGESIALGGTPYSLRYWSSRHRIPAQYSLDIPVSPDSVPQDATGYVLEAAVAGKLTRVSFGPQPNQIYHLEWDAQDPYSRLMQGPASVHLRLGAVLRSRYGYFMSAATAATFGVPCNWGVEVQAGGTLPNCVVPESLVAATGETPRTADTLWVDGGSEYQEQLQVGGWDAAAEKFGGWTLDVHHVLDRSRGQLYLGTGETRGASGLPRLFGLIRAVVGLPPACSSASDPRCAADTVSAAVAGTIQPHGIAAGPDGAVYFSEGQTHLVRKVTADGTVIRVAGNRSVGASGDGGPAPAAGMEPTGLAVGSDGSLFVADYGNHRIRRIDANGAVTTVAGTGVCGDGGDGGPATAATLCYPEWIAAAADGSLFVNSNGASIRRIGPDGIVSRYAGKSNDYCYYSSAWRAGGTAGCGDGGRALDATFGWIEGIAAAPDGSIYVVDNGNAVVRRIRPDGVIERVAGKPLLYSGSRLDGGPALSARLLDPTGIALGKDGGVYFADGNTVRYVGGDGIINTIAGATGCSWGSSSPLCVKGSANGGLATQQTLSTTGQLAIGADGHVYLAEVFNSRVTRLEGALPNLQTGDVVVPSEDGTEYYEFDNDGRHVRTWDAMRRVKLLEFGFDSSGLVTSVTDVEGNVTRIVRGPDGNARDITGPYGQHTSLSYDANGYLSGVIDVAGDTVALRHSAIGSLTHLTDAEGGDHTFTYTAFGNLLADAGADGGTSRLDVTDATGSRVTVRTSEGRTRTNGVTFTLDGGVSRTSIAPDGLVTTSVQEPNGRTTVTTPDGTTTVTIAGGDPRFGMQSPFGASQIVTIPGGPTVTMRSSRNVTVVNSDPFSLALQLDTLVVNGAATVSRYDAAAKTMTSTSAQGRVATRLFDDMGRMLRLQTNGLSATDLAYDASGRLQSVTDQGRRVTMTYGTDGRLASATRPLGQTTRLTRDAVGRIVSTTRPDGGIVAYSYNRNGALSSVTPPGQAAHHFSYTPAGRLAAYVAPDVGDGRSRTTRYGYDRDGLVTSISKADGAEIGVARDSAGRLTTISLGRDSITMGYTPTGRLSAVAASSGTWSLALTSQGPLVGSVTQSGVAQGTIAFGYDNFLRVSAVAVNQDTATYAYDLDGLPTRAGALAIQRGSASGLEVGSALGVVTTRRGHDASGALVGDTTFANGSVVFAYSVAYDSLQRIVARVDSTDGAAARWSYAYDSASRLADVWLDGKLLAHYAYDLNGNRREVTSFTGVVAPAHDAQDRLLTYGAWSYAYTAAGELRYKTSGADTTWYEHDALGALRAVVLPDGTRIEYVVDGANRRIARSVNGSVVQRFIYAGAYGPEAEVDQNGRTVTRFVYGTRPNVPDYMVRGGATYRIVADHLGSVRAVVEAQSGQVVQRIDYDAYGRVLSDSRPGFQPFGFAGGLWDASTGLTHFGARDYDASVGRWITKDPAGFGGGSTNLYEYAAGDPVDVADPSGEKIFVAWHIVTDKAGGPYYHTFLDVVPDDGGEPFTIGAGPTGLMSGLLRAGINRDSDVLDVIGGGIPLPLPPCTTDREMIARLLSLLANYQQHVLPYAFLGLLGGDAFGYNSNSFTSGLIQAAGFQVPAIPANVPKWNNPVDRRYFQPLRKIF